jgi:hypothetical protein
MITREDLQMVFDLAESAIGSTDRQREALWAIQRELIAATPPEIADVVWCMASDPKPRP